MPKSITDDQGVVHEVFTQEEVAEAQKLADEKVAALEKEKVDLEQQVNPNWKKARTTIDTLKNSLKSAGKEVDDDGNLIEKTPNISVEEIDQRAEKKAQEVILNNYKNQVLSKYDTERRKVVELTFNKLAAGEELSTERIDEIVKQAEYAHFPPQAPTRRNMPIGNPVEITRAEENRFSETDAGKDLAARMGLSFVKKQS